MKTMFIASTFMAFNFISFQLAAQKGNADIPASEISRKHLFIDVHQLEPGKVTYGAVAEAHAKDLAIEYKYDVKFLKYWVDEKKAWCFACLLPMTVPLSGRLMQKLMGYCQHIYMM